MEDIIMKKMKRLMSALRRNRVFTRVLSMFLSLVLIFYIISRFLCVVKRGLQNRYRKQHQKDQLLLLYVQGRLYGSQGRYRERQAILLPKPSLDREGVSRNLFRLTDE